MILKYSSFWWLYPQHRPSLVTWLSEKWGPPEKKIPIGWSESLFCNAWQSKIKLSFFWELGMRGGELIGNLYCGSIVLKVASICTNPLLSKDAAQSGWLVFNTLRTCGPHPEARSLEHLLTNWFNQALHCYYITSNLVQDGYWKNKVR